jgi:hypothetical protein
MIITPLSASALVALTLTACIFRDHVPYTPDPARQLGRQTVFRTDPLFRDPPTALPVENHTLDDEETDAYRVRSPSFPSIGENGQKNNRVTALYYQSKSPGKKKLVIVLPIQGG